MLHRPRLADDAVAKTLRVETRRGRIVDFNRHIAARVGVLVPVVGQFDRGFLAFVATQGAEATLIGGPQQSAEGLFKANGACLAARNGLVGGTAAGPNPVRAEACPTLAATECAGGGAFSRALWVRAGDGTIQTKHTYCLTAPQARIGGQIVLETCVSGARAQQWQVVRPAGANGNAQLVSNQNGRCLTHAANGDLSLQPCNAANQIWTTPGRRFAY